MDLELSQIKGGQSKESPCSSIWALLAIGRDFCVNSNIEKLCHSADPCDSLLLSNTFWNIFQNALRPKPFEMTTCFLDSMLSVKRTSQISIVFSIPSLFKNLQEIYWTDQILPNVEVASRRVCSCSLHSRLVSVLLPENFKFGMTQEFWVQGTALSSAISTCIQSGRWTVSI